MHSKSLSNTLRRKNYLNNLAVHSRITFKWILKKKERIFIYLTRERKQRQCRFIVFVCEHGNETSNFIKTKEFLN